MSILTLINMSKKTNIGKLIIFETTLNLKLKEWQLQVNAFPPEINYYENLCCADPADKG